MESCRSRGLHAAHLHCTALLRVPTEPGSTVGGAAFFLFCRVEIKELGFLASALVIST